MIASIFFICHGLQYRDEERLAPLAQRLARTVPIHPERSNVAWKLPAGKKFDFGRRFLPGTADFLRTHDWCRQIMQFKYCAICLVNMQGG
jgi:hypothetical protein